MKWLWLLAVALSALPGWGWEAEPPTVLRQPKSLYVQKKLDCSKVLKKMHDRFVEIAEENLAAHRLHRACVKDKNAYKEVHDEKADAQRECRLIYNDEVEQITERIKWYKELTAADNIEVIGQRFGFKISMSPVGKEAREKAVSDFRTSMDFYNQIWARCQVSSRFPDFLKKFEDCVTRKRIGFRKGAKFTKNSPPEVNMYQFSEKSEDCRMFRDRYKFDYENDFFSKNAIQYFRDHRFDHEGLNVRNEDRVFNALVDGFETIQNEDAKKRALGRALDEMIRLSKGSLRHLKSMKSDGLYGLAYYPTLRERYLSKLGRGPAKDVKTCLRRAKSPMKTALEGAPFHDVVFFPQDINSGDYFLGLINHDERRRRNTAVGTEFLQDLALILLPYTRLLSAAEFGTELADNNRQYERYKPPLQRKRHPECCYVTSKVDHACSPRN